MSVERDEFGQYAKPMEDWTEQEWKLFLTLEQIPDPDDADDRSIAVFMADVLDLFQ